MTRVSLRFLAAGVAAALVLGPLPMDAQSADPRDFGKGSKNAVGAFMLEYLIPGAGHVYARDTWGAVNVVGMVAAGTMMGMRGNSSSVVNAGIAIAIAGRVWGLVDAPRAARRHNRRR